jgi:hypothetical protein
MLTSATAKNPSGFASADPLRQGPHVANAAKCGRAVRSIPCRIGQPGDCCAPGYRLLQQNHSLDSIKIIELREGDWKSAASR